MRKSKEHFRHEWKYLINRAEKQLTDLRLRECMQLDPHAGEGGYMIRSLYFDDYWNSAMEEKDAGVLMRKKYRIRIYNCSDKSIKLERKKKFGSYIYKEAAPLTRQEVEWILDGKYEFLLRSAYRLCTEFYLECVCNIMRPRAAVGSYDIFDSSLPTLDVLEPGKLVMEVKYTEFLPQIVRNLVPQSASEFTAVSKFVLCCEKTRYLHGFEYWAE